MPQKKKGKRQNAKNREEIKRELVFKEDGQEYAQVEKMLGNGRLTALCFDGKTRLGIIRGKMKKKVWVHIGDFILVGLRDFQDEKCDVIQKYSVDEARQLKAYGELPDTAKINEDTGFDISEQECAFEFTNEIDDDESEKSEENEIDLEDI